MPATRRPRLLVAVLALCTLLGALTVPAAVPARAALGPDAVPGPVVLVGVPGLRWDDVDPERTPALWSLLEDGAAGVLAARSVRSRACPVDGWLAVSAGRRAGDAPREPGEPLCRVPQDPVDGVVPRWDVYAAEAAAGDFDAEPGLLGEQLRAADVRAAAVGPGAAIALADTDGAVVGDYRRGATEPAALAADVRAVADRDLVVVDAGALRDPDDLPPSDPKAFGPDRLTQAAALDARVGAVLDAVPDGATVLVAALADAGLTARLQLTAATGPAPGGSAYAEALLASSSTRQDGIVQATDLTPTLLALLDLDAPASLVGAPVVPLAGSSPDAADRLERLLDVDAASRAVQPLVPWFFNLLVAAQLALYGAAALALRNRWRGPEGRRRVLAGLRRVSVLFAAVPVSTFLANLVPWWRADNDFLAVVAAVAVFAVLVAVVAQAGPWGRRPLGPLGVVSGITALVLAADVVAGTRLITSSLMGLQPVVAGRFYGLGNVQYALFATGALLAATALADHLLRRGRRSAAVTAVAVIGVVAVVVDGAPGLGSDFGGPPSMIPAFALLALVVGGVRISWRSLLLIGLGTLAAATALSVVDWLRPPDDRTHLGRFVQTVLDGGAWTVVERKLAQNVEILFGSWLSVLVPVGALFIGLILMRPVAWGAPALQRTYEYCPALRPGLTALIVMLAIGFAVNDSGTVVPAVGATLAIPLLIAASVRVLEIEDDSRSGPAPGDGSAAQPAQEAERARHAGRR
ncbi:hypothetical protein ACFP6A_08570 [Quadrisphaera sp. GCM10027208]|uniref:hypothetical protein n=1 Tax=Quadrisphaera sp. GCM10027208 TaxID=3273423 RepID=UPI003616A400